MLSYYEGARFLLVAGGSAGGKANGMVDVARDAKKRGTVYAPLECTLCFVPSHTRR